MGSAYWQGFRAGVPFVLVVAPFGLLFGVVATEAGLDIVQTMVMTVLVIAGASQFAAVQLLSDNAPTFVAILTGLAVNMRMAMYSASLTPHLGKASLGMRSFVAYFLVDQSYAISVAEYEKAPARPLPEKLAYFFGSVSPIAPLWYGFTYVGAVAGEAIPPEYALDFAVPITFIAIVAPALRSLPHIAAAFVSVAAALLLAWLPYNSGLMIAALLAMITGAAIEKRL
ncbi:MAG TPA: branched-chain amino acid ABC transporter permease, partial [Rhodobacteraceae bacterium]|nr:branched-chain amino acid ABC transporter permease [Paracoccaceae bacterium]